MLDRLLDALRDPTSGDPHFGTADFEAATFKEDASFDSVIFKGKASFDSATFEGPPRFWAATFQGDASFVSTTFKGDLSFVSMTPEGPPGFGSTTFEARASFAEATFAGAAWFNSALFKGHTWFGSTTFESDVSFETAIFEDDAWFHSTIFKQGAEFRSANFRGSALFASTTFDNSAWFGSTTFRGHAMFRSVIFKGDAWFESAAFDGHASFASTTFEAGVGMESVTFGDDAHFGEAVFERDVSLGPFVCAGRVVLSGAVFRGPATLLFAARRLECRRTRWLSVAALHLRYTTVDFAHAVFEYPLTIAAEPEPFVLLDGRPVAEPPLAHAPDATVRIVSLRGVDAAHLVLADIDLSGCLFTGTVHLDQLRLEGTCSFDVGPPRTYRLRWRPVRFTQRRTLAEEHHWRASQPAAVRGWHVGVLGAGRVGPAQLAPVYRALRKAFEDSKNEPGAADFYYGEMEMRRHDPTSTTRGERGLLHGYWLLSGYGLRASRALLWLAAAMFFTIVLLMGFGLPKDAPKQQATGTVPANGGQVSFEIDNADPQNPEGQRFTGQRFEKALNVTLNSVVFRSSGQDLTTTGTYIEMASRVTEPILLGLAVLAIRNRVKR
ncbi:pentapeptide repeat-containing protein [Streptomyces sp. NPDC056437]|uniref:pentapeptide repeat-containing protein n=1 Tax=Streptomyces sp. NPDC056437 TaxID=3345816 RepID=UPI003695AA06